MPNQSWQQTIVAASVDGAALTASTTPTSILPAAAKVIVPGGFLQVGSVLRVKAAGRISTVVTTPGTLTLDLRLAAGGIVVANGGAISLNVVAKTDVPWMLEWILTCRAIGTSANFMHQGVWQSEAVSENGALLIPSGAPVVGSSFDSTAPQTIDMFATWNLNNANSVQVHQMTIDSLN